MAYQCDLCSGAEAATFLMTPLTGGDTMAIGSACAITGLCGLLSVAADVDAEALYDALVALKDQPAPAPADGPAQPSVAAGASAGRKRAASVTPLPAGRTARPRATTAGKRQTAGASAPVVPDSGPESA